MSLVEELERRQRDEETYLLDLQDPLVKAALVMVRALDRLAGIRREDVVPDIRGQVVELASEALAEAERLLG